MKNQLKSVRSLFVVFVFFAVLNGICIAEDLQNGFGGIDWATKLDQVRDCQKIEDREGIQYCFRHDQAHTLMGEPAPAVLYGFYQDAFFGVFIQIENDEAYGQSKTRLMDRLGTPQVSFDKEGTASTLRWTEGLVRVELFNDRSKEGFRLVYYYLPVADKALRKHKALLPSKWSKIKLFSVEKGDETEHIGILQF